MATTANTTNGFPRPRNRTIPLAHFSEEARAELQEIPRLRPVTGKKDKDRDRLRDSSYRNKKKRGSRREESEQIIEHTVENERDYRIDDAGALLVISPHTASSASDQSHQRMLLPARPVRPTLPPWKPTDEMIGVTVPRKARSASAKRLHDSWASTNGGGAAEQNSRQRSNSSGRQSVGAASPSSSDESVRKKMKAIGPMASPPKTSKPSSTNQEDIEIEIAELLYGLMASKKQECLQNHETNETHGISHDTKTSDSFSATNPRTSVSPRRTSPSIHPSTDVEKRTVEDYNSSTPVPNKSTSDSVKFESGQPVKVETLSPKFAKMSCFNDENATGREAGQSGALKEGIAEGNLNSGTGCGVTADGRPVSLKGESPSCSKLDVDEKEISANIESFAVPEANSQRVNKFEIDLMAPPPMAVSPERDDFTSEHKALAPEVELRRENNIKVKDKVERQVKKEREPEETEEMKMDAFKEKRDILIFDYEKPNKYNNSTASNKLEEQNRNLEQPHQSANPKVEKIVQSRSVPLSTATPGCSSSLSLHGNMLPLQTVVKSDKTIGSLTTSQDASFVLSQPLPKRCATHHYIARNIFLHQQFTQTNHIWPAAVASASLCGTKPNDVNRVPSAESMVIAKQSQKNLPGLNQNAGEKEWATSSFLGLSANESSDTANCLDSTQRKHVVPQQGPYPSSASNVVNGPALLFPRGQRQSSVTAATSQAGGLNSTNSASSSNKPNRSAAASLCSSSALPAVTSAMNFSHSNLAANDAPYVTIVQNNGYPFPFSTPIGATAAIRGTSPAQTTHLLNGAFYSSQMFHPLQHPQQHPHSQVLVQPGYINTNTSNVSSSSSHKQSRGAQVDGNNILTSATTQLQRSQKQHISESRPRKLETELGGDNAPSYSQKNVYAQNLKIPVQPVNLLFRPSATPDSTLGSGKNFGDQQQKQQALGEVELVPSQAFAISFAAFNGTSPVSNLNFSSMAQNPVIFQSLPDIEWQGFQATGTSRTAQLGTYSMCEGKSGGNSSHQDDEKKAISGKSSKNGPTTLNFDNSSKNLNFVLSPMNGSWPCRSIPGNVSSSQKLLQLQKKYGIQQQQPSMASQYKALPSNATSATKFVSNPPIFSKNPSQCNSSNQASQSKSSGRTTDPQVHQASIITTNNPSLKNFYQEPGRVLQGHTQISFGGNYETSLPPQGQQQLNNSKSVCTKVAGPPPNGGNLKPNSQGSKLDSSINTLQMQQNEDSSAGSGQKSSQVCGRNVLSLLGPSHISELKY